MRYALVNNQRVLANKEAENAICECCKMPVKPFCGKINIEHFRHLQKNDCDSWYEPISEWHLNWQNMFPENFREIVILKNGKAHRADILNSKGTVIELQKSFISPEEIKQRESFYEKMVWIFSGIEFRKNFNVCFKWTTDIKTSDKRVKAYNWSYPKKHIYTCQKPVFIDFGTDYLYWINFLSNKKPEFRSSYRTTSGDEYYDVDEGDYKEIYETVTSYYWYPVKLISKSSFMAHYSV